MELSALVVGSLVICCFGGRCVGGWLLMFWVVVGLALLLLITNAVCLCVYRLCLGGFVCVVVILCFVVWLLRLRIMLVCLF